MVIEINTIVSVAPPRGNNLGNITLMDAKFFGRPNFGGEMDQFKDDSRKFTVLIPNEVADELRNVGWNVKTKIPTQEELAEFPDRQPISHLKVKVDENTSQVLIKMGEVMENLNPNTFGVLDRSRVIDMDMELRAWMYNGDEVRQGLEQPKYSARLVTVVANIEVNLIAEKYGRIL